MSTIEGTGQPSDAQMPFTAHLAELRHRLVKSVIAVAIAFFACYWVVDDIFAILAAPLRRLIEEEAVMCVEDLLLRRTDWGRDPRLMESVASRFSYSGRFSEKLAMELPINIDISTKPPITPTNTIVTASQSGTRRLCSHLIGGIARIDKNAENSTGTKIGPAARSPATTTTSEAPVMSTRSPIARFSAMANGTRRKQRFSAPGPATPRASRGR